MTVQTAVPFYLSAGMWRLVRAGLAIFAGFLFCTSGVLSFDDPAIVEAQKLFKQYTDLEHAYDPAQADLFSPTASIKDTHLYQEGPAKTLTWTGENYKLIIKAQLPIAKARGEQYVYSQLSFTREGNNVRIKCSRYSTQKKFAGPLEMLLAPNGKSGWKIIEETCQSQP